MPKQILVVFTNPVEGKEDEYNAWYNGRHLGDVVGTGPFVRAQRFRLEDVDPHVPSKFRYLAIYEVEDGKLQAARDWLVWAGAEHAEALEAGREPQVPMTDALHEKRVIFFFEAMGDPLEKPVGDEG